MKHQARVTRVVKEAPGVSTIYFKIDFEPFTFTAGQYISVYFDQTGNKSGKAYSLSSAPDDSELSITVKNIGQFSGLLCGLEPGDTFVVSSPFGFFNVSDELPIVAIASGVGVSPIWSIICDELKRNTDRRISLFLTAPTVEELVFKKKIDRLFKQANRASCAYFATREDSAELFDITLGRRFTVAEDLHTEHLSSSRFYVCGAEDFVRSVWRQLMEAGVDENKVVTETFFESAS